MLFRFSVDVLPCCTQVNPSDLSNDADPKFLAEFYKNLKILSQDLYKKSVVASTNASAPFGSPAGKGMGMGMGSNPANSSNNSKLAKYKSASFGPKNADMQHSMAAAVASLGSEESSSGASGGAGGNAAFAHPADYFTAESLHERMKMYAQQGGIPLDYLDRYAASAGGASAAGAATGAGGRDGKGGTGGAAAADQDE